MTRKTLYFLTEVPPTSFDPAAAFDLVSYNVSANLFEGLVAQDPQTLEIVPGVACSWQEEEAGRVYTFQIRDNAAFSDGSPITADDVVYSLTRVSGYRNVELQATATGERTVRVELQRPVPNFLDVLAGTAFAIVAKGARFDSEELVCSGAFRLKAELKDEQTHPVVLVERNPHYWNASAVKLDQALFIPVMEAEERLRIYRNQQTPDGQPLHYFLHHAPPLRYHELVQSAELRRSPVLGTICYSLNTRKRPLDDARVRQALSLSLNRESIIANIAPHVEVADALVPKHMQNYPEQRGLLAADPARAKALLAEAGYENGSGFPVLTITVFDYEYQTDMASSFAADLKDTLGIEVSVEPVSWAEYLRRMENQDFDLLYETWHADLPEAGSFLTSLTSDHTLNTPGYSNKEYDALLAAAEAETDLAKRAALYQKAEELAVREMPVIPLFYRYHLSMVSPGVSGLHESVTAKVLLQHVDVAASKAVQEEGGLLVQNGASDSPQGSADEQVSVQTEIKLDAMLAPEKVTPNLKSMPKRLTKAVTSRIVSEW